MSSTSTSISWPTLSISLGWLRRLQLMSVMWSRPSRPSRSMNAPKSVMFLTVPLTVRPFRCRRAACALLGAFGFDQFAAGEDDVLALLVELDDFELVGVADVNAQILRRDDVDLGAGQECLDADVEHEAALDDGLDLAGDEPPLLKIWTIFSQFFLNSAFSWERTTVPSLVNCFFSALMNSFPVSDKGLSGVDKGLSGVDKGLSHARKVCQTSTKVSR
jgi:hypothetical protein